MTVLAGNMFAAGLRAEFLQIYEQAYRGLAGLDVAMDRDIPSDKNHEKFAYWTSTPYMRQWRRGQTMTQGEFQSVQWTVYNKEWALAIKWHYADLQDDLTKTLASHARRGGANAATLDERIFFQILTSASDPLLLDSIPSAPDGVSLFYATDGAGANRFGASSGNLLSGSGVATSVAIRTDIYKSLVQFGTFTDTEGQPLHDPGVIDQGITVYAGVANQQVFEEALYNRLTTWDTKAAGNVQVSNLLSDAGKNIKLVLTQRISDNDWFVMLNGSNVKPVFSMLRDPMRDVTSTFDNSDNARDTGMESIRWFMRKGYGVALPYGIIKIDN